ncbi:hypothetical protein Q8A73_016319 [Channa argus]|nr:hypothetical protein Q8A73_016319 [Channa argus]
MLKKKVLSRYLPSGTNAGKGTFATAGLEYGKSRLQNVGAPLESLKIGGNAVDVAEISPTRSPSSRCKLRTQSPVAQTASASSDSSASLIGNAGQVGVSYGWPWFSWGEVGGQLRPEGWHEVVGRIDGAGWRRGVGGRRERGSSPSPSRALEETQSVDGNLPHDRLKRTDSRPEPSQPVRTSPESASSAHAYCSAHPPWAVPGSSPNSRLSRPLSVLMAISAPQLLSYNRPSPP